MVHVLGARKAGTVRISPRASDAMAPDAELLPRAAVAACASHGIDPRLCAVPSAASPAAHPARWVRARRRSPGADMRSRVAVDARRFAVAGGAEPGIGPPLVGMARFEAGAMKPGEAHVVEDQPRRERGDRPRSMARSARSFAVAGRTEIALARGMNAVLTEPVAVVHEVARRRGVLGREIDVASVAVAK